MTAIPTDAANENLSVDDAAEALLSKWSRTDEDAKQPSTESEPDIEEDETDVEPDEETTDEDATEPSEDEVETEDSEYDEEDERDEDEEPKTKRTLEDNTVVKIKVDGEEIEASVKDLKRLYGQEAALTKKSQAVSAKLKEVEETGAKYVTSLGALLNRAKERAEPFAQIDWLIASKNLSDEELTALRSEAQKTFDDVNFFSQELDGFMRNAEQQRQTVLVEQAREAVGVLKKEIPGWNEKVYDDIRSFAINGGIDSSIVNNLVDPAAIKMLHMAMLYSKGKQAVTTKKNKTPKKLVKSTVSGEATGKAISSSKQIGAVEKLKKSGSVDDATEAFLARWSAEN